MVVKQHSGFFPGLPSKLALINVRLADATERSFELAFILNKVHRWCLKCIGIMHGVLYGKRYCVLASKFASQWYLVRYSPELNTID